MNTKSSGVGHLLAIFTISVWGTTYISSKVVLTVLTPVELLLIRFVLGYAALWLIYPKPMKTKNLKEEAVYAAGGLTGITLYYLLENTALVYTQASNVGVIIAIAPFFTAIGMVVFRRGGERITVRFLLGFLIAMAGIFLLSFQGAAVELHLFGDLLAILASLMWAAYCILSKNAFSMGYDVIPATRRMFFYGIIFMIPFILIQGFSPSIRELTKPVILINLLFLGVVGCAVCFASWNAAVKLLGAIKTSIYIYLTPVVTTVTSVLILKETITLAAGTGIVLTLLGLILSSSKESSQEAENDGRLRNSEHGRNAD